MQEEIKQEIIKLLLDVRESMGKSFDESNALIAELERENARLNDESLRFYNADSSYETLDSAEAVTAKRIECAAELAELRAVEAKLPKIWRLDDAGKLVQDVVVNAGDNAYALDGADNNCVRKVGIQSIEAVGEGESPRVCLVGSNGDEWAEDVDFIYTSEEAALAKGGES